MSNRPVFFEFHSQDPEATQEFFEDVFDWQIAAFPDVEDYFVATTGDPGQPGIDGGIMKSRDSASRTTITVDVENLDASIAEAMVRGGVLVVPKMAIPGVGYVAYCVEPGGVLFGMVQQADVKPTAE